MFDARQIEYVLAIAEEQSLTRAAEKLFISQSALSQQLKKLYDTGVPTLFEYHGGRMLPTEAGRLYINGARTIIKIRDETVRELSEPGSIDYPPLRIALLKSMQRSFYLHLVPEFKEKYPDVRLDLRTLNYANIREQLQGGKLDMAVFGTTEDILPEDTFPLEEEELAIAVPAGTNGPQLPVVLNQTSSNLYSLQTKALRAWALSPEVYAYCNDIEGALDMVSLGICCTVADTSLIRRYSGVRALPSPVPFRYRLAVACGSGYDTLPPMQHMLSLLQEHYGAGSEFMRTFL